MRRNTIRLGAVGLSLIAVSSFIGSVRATPAAGFSGTTVALGRFDSIDVFNHLATTRETRRGGKKDHWLSWQKTKGPSDLYVQDNVWAAGGSTGWHTHPGHSLIVVTAGTLTVYEGDDQSCTPEVYTTGMGFVDPGGDHVHNIRNEDAVEARTMAVQLIPAGAARRIDAEKPAGCES